MMSTLVDTGLLESEFETPSLSMIPHWKVSFFAPQERY